MTTLRDRQHSPYTPAQLFALVADVERYPEFLPWAVAARIVERASDSEFLAELTVRFKGLTERYTSRVTLTAPDAAGQGGMVRAEMIKGPFSHLVNEWRFTPAEGGAEIDFFLDFAFNSKLLEMMLGGLFGKAQGKMIEAFRARADELYKKA